MFKDKLINTISWLTMVISIIGIISFYIDKPSVVYIAASITIFNSLIQVVFGGQNSFATEVFTVFLALVLSIFMSSPTLLVISLFLCFSDAIIGLLGLLQLILIKF